ncbi:MAG TPA: zf-HC2 domain-containing protein [Actinocrinis sp.]|uniref:anti-sigma factor family protein n=1 Tax=Actinocrinis sp. TaxID=1920516 RepID=UPI002DDD8356|nr:zf-HC2 domain-containing protein [Actinocrinis sp.]HEV3170961.1 zf-HC2 domain-containing protein [Actinocrinis sp.]
MTTEQRAPESDPHIDVAAYALGLLDPAEAAAFEDHLAGCDICADELESMVALEPILAEFGAERQPPADPGAPTRGKHAAGLPSMPGSLTQPQPQQASGESSPMLDALIGRVAESRKRSRLRRMYALAAAIVLIVGGPVVASVITASNHNSTVQGEGTGPTNAPLPVTGEQHSAVNSVTGASATVGLVSMKWGTHVALKLSGVHGPLTCDLVAVSKTGQRQVVATWIVPSPGYGVPGATAPLVLYGGAGMKQSDIDHFDVETTTGQNLVTIPV